MDLSRAGGLHCLSDKDDVKDKGSHVRGSYSENWSLLCNAQPKPHRIRQNSGRATAIISVVLQLFRDCQITTLSRTHNSIVVVVLLSLLVVVVLVLWLLLLIFLLEQVKPLGSARSTKQERCKALRFLLSLSLCGRWRG